MSKMARKTKTITEFIKVCGLLQLVVMIVLMVIIKADITTPVNADESTTVSENVETQESIYETTTHTEPEITESIKVTEITESETSEFTEATEITEPETTEATVVETIVPETQPEKEKVLEYRYGKRMTPAVDINIPTGNDMRNSTGEVDTSNYTYLGTYKITGYTPKCVHCCGNDKGITASGVEAISGYTVATHKNLPFGTTLYIEGYGYYVVEDRGHLATNVIDIAAPTHDSCYTLTNNGVNVYIVHH